MNRKLLCFLCVCFVFVFPIVKADVLLEPNIIKINNILVYEDVADKIFKDARHKSIDIFDAKDRSVKVNEITKQAKNAEVIIDSALMNEVVKLYNEAVSSGEEESIVLARSEGNKIVIYVDKTRGILTTLIVQ